MYYLYVYTHITQLILRTVVWLHVHALASLTFKCLEMLIGESYICRIQIFVADKDDEGSPADDYGEEDGDGSDNGDEIKAGLSTSISINVLLKMILLIFYYNFFR